jgi:hypothetical protein
MRLLAKASCAFLAFEVALTSVPPPFGARSSFDILHLQRERFPLSTLPSVDDALDVGNLDAMFAAHVVSRPKQASEFRVLVLGDSAAWGLRLSSSQTLASQLNGLDLACGSNSLRFYDLSFPRPSASKDLMILDKAVAYQPDLIVWFITWYTLMPKARDDHWLITQNPAEFAKLAERFDFLPKDYRAPSLPELIVRQNRSLFRVTRFQLYPFITLATGRDQIIGEPADLPSELSPDTTFEGLKPPSLRQKQVSLDQVDDFYKLAGSVPVILINEPMLIVQGQPNSDVRYNNYYPRWVYDQYRKYVQDAATENAWNYLDLWAAMPAPYFEDTPLHLTPAGQKLFAQSLAPEILKQCR